MSVFIQFLISSFNIHPVRVSFCRYQDKISRRAKISIGCRNAFGHRYLVEGLPGRSRAESFTISSAARSCSCVSSSYGACRGLPRAITSRSSLESFSTLNERDKFLLRAPGSGRTRGREFTTAIKISLKLFMGNAYAPLARPRKKKAPNLLLRGRSLARKRRRATSNGRNRYA